MRHPPDAAFIPTLYLYRRAGITFVDYVEFSGFRKTMPIRSRDFRDWIVFGCRRTTGRRPTARAVEAALDLMDVVALAPEQRRVLLSLDCGGRA